MLHVIPDTIATSKLAGSENQALEESAARLLMGMEFQPQAGNGATWGHGKRSTGDSTSSAKGAAMIPTSLGMLVFIYTRGLLLAIFALWLVRGMWRRGARKRPPKTGDPFARSAARFNQAPDDQALPPCPQCKHPNERHTSPHEV